MPSPRSIGIGFAGTGLAIGALIPVFLVLYPAAGLGAGAMRDPAVVLDVFGRTPLLFAGPGILEVAGHVIGALAIVGLWLRFGGGSTALACATLGGIVWMTVDVLDNAVAIQLVPQLAADHLAGDVAATSSFRLVMALVDAVRLGGHLVGGLWVVGASAVLLRSGVLHPVIGWIGVGVGAVLAANPFVPALLNVSFMTLPLWLVAFGVAIARVPDGTVGASSAAIPLRAGARP